MNLVLTFLTINDLIGRLTKDQEVTDIWPVSELLNAYINVFFVKFET